ncbi:MAG TPA: thioredoxin domain-containing protein [Kofleriaceae bacterium]|jgi:protein-disulfide isomerase
MKCALVLLCAASTAHAGGATQLGSGAGFQPATVYKVPIGAAPTEGPADAPITIVDWSDYGCAYCNAVQDTLDRLDRLYPGLIRWVHRALPIDEDDLIGLEAARAAAAQGKFRPMHRRLYELHGKVDRASVELIARELGLDMLQFRGDLDAGAAREQLATDLADARTLGVVGTPMFFINGRAVFGNQPLHAFSNVIDQELARAGTLAATHPRDLYEAEIAAGQPSADGPDTQGDDAPRLDLAAIYRVGLGLPGQSIGPDDALVTIVEFSDFACPFCAKEAPVLAHLRQKFGADLRLVYRHYPVLFHPESTIAAEAGAAAAAQGKFWAFHDQVFANFGKLSRADLEHDAQAAGLDLKQFRAALDDHRFHDAVMAEGSAGEALGVTGTPTLFINGQPVIGAADEPILDRIVQAHLDHAKDAVAHGLRRAEVYPVIMTMAQGEDRADPSAVPEPSQLEMHSEDRGRAVDAACRRRDTARATQLAARLAGDARKRAAAVCAGQGIDLP